MEDINTQSLKKGWVFSNIKGMRDSGQWCTYYHFDYDKLPLINIVLDDSFSWLKPYPKYDKYLDSELQNKFTSIKAQASAQGLNLPQSFINFFEDEELRSRVRSNTDCYFDLPDIIEEIPHLPNHYAIGFLADSQGCCYWYLVLDKNSNDISNSFVMLSTNLYGCADEDAEELKYLEPEAGVFCAPSFEEFIFRFWIENEIWFKLNDGAGALSGLEKTYVNHYIA